MAIQVLFVPLATTTTCVCRSSKLKYFLQLNRLQFIITESLVSIVPISCPFGTDHVPSYERILRSTFLTANFLLKIYKFYHIMLFYKSFQHVLIRILSLPTYINENDDGGGITL